MAIGAGQLVLVDGHDLSGDVTQFDAEFSRVIVERSALAHHYRRRKVQGQRDRAWSMSAFWERDRAAKVFRGGNASAPLLSRVMGDEVGAEAFNFRDVLSPKAPTETPLGDLIRWSTEGFVNEVGDGGTGYLLNRGAPFALTSVGNNDLWGSRNLDIGASNLNRTLRVYVHLHSPVPYSTLQVHSASTLGGTRSHIPNLNVANLENRISPSSFTSSTHTGLSGRYLGLRIVTAAATRLHMRAAALDVTHTGVLQEEQGTIPVGGVIQPAFPGPGIVATASHVDIYVTGTHALVTPTNSPNQLILRWRERGTSSFNTDTCPFQSASGGVDRFRGSVTQAFEHGKDYDIEIRRAGASNSHSLNDGTGEFDATVLVEVS